MHSVYTTFIVNKDVHGQTQLIAHITRSNSSTIL